MAFSHLRRRFALTTTLLQNPSPLSQSLLCISSIANANTGYHLESRSGFTSFSPNHRKSYLPATRCFSIATSLPKTSFPTQTLSPWCPFGVFARNHLHHSENRRLSTSTDPGNPKEPPPELRHQEITGPTVERDTSALANETRQELESLRKAIYDLSVSMVLLGGAHLGLGAWIAYSARGIPQEVSVQGVAAFALPFVSAFLMRNMLKPMCFFSKMEGLGRLQILTLALQSTKNLRTMLLRIRVAVLFCMIGMSATSLSMIWAR